MKVFEHINLARSQVADSVVVMNSIQHKSKMLNGG